MMITRTITSILFLLAASAVHGAPDTVDPVFANSAGQVFDDTDFGGISSILVQPDGKVLFGSNEMAGTVAGNGLNLSLIRFNPDGSVDHTFSADNLPDGTGTGIFFDSAGSPEVHALGLDSSGNIIAAGVMQGMRDGTDSLTSQSIVRISPDGSLDTSFQTAGTTPAGGFNYIEEVTIQPDDKILAVGGFGGIRDSFALPSVPRLGIARFNTDGSLDTGFNIDPDEFAIPSGVTNLSGFFRQVSLDASGNLYLAGEFTWGSTFPRDSLPVFARLFPDGSRDLSFNPSLPADLGLVTGCVVAPSGKITVLANTEGGGSWMARFEPDGSRDASFTLDPSLGRVTARPLEVAPNGNYLLTTGSVPSAPQDTLVRILPDGSLDPTFNAAASFVSGPPGISTAYFGNFTTAPTGRIYAGSFFDTVNGVSTKKLVAFEGDEVPSAPGSIAFTAPTFSTTEEKGSASIGVRRVGGDTGSASASFSLTPVTATTADYTPTSVTVSFADGESGTKYIEVPITADALVENPEVANLSLGSITGATAGTPTSATLTILDSNSPPEIVVQPRPLYVPPGNSFILSVGVLSGADPTTYQWFKDGAPVAGATAPLYAVTSADASSHDGSYSVQVTNPNGTTLSNTADVVVKNPAILSFSSADFSGLESDGSLTLTLSRSGSSVGAVSVDVATAVGSATAADFTQATTTVSWVSGDSSDQTVTVTLNDDALVESPESFTASLLNFSADANPGAITSATATILDDDSPPSITSQPGSRSVGEGSSITFSVTAESQSPLSYQWYGPSGLIAGATSASYSIASAAPGDSGDYSVELTNAAGTLISETAQLFVAPGPHLVAPDFTAAPSFNGAIYAIEVLDDGTAIVAGNFTTVDGTSAPYLVKLDATGAVAPITFAAPNSSVTAIAVQPDGKILIGGAFSTVGGTNSRALARLNADGSVDTAFAGEIGLNFPLYSSIADIALLSDGRIAVGGKFSPYGVSPFPRHVMLLNPDGTPDPDFSPQLTTGSVSVRVTALEVDAQDRILIGGFFEYAGASRIARLLDDGSRDLSFDDEVTSFNSQVQQIAELRDGRIALVGSHLSGGSFRIVDDRGAVLTAGASINTLYTLGIQPNGKLLIGGSYSGTGFDRFEADGSFDSTFRANLGSGHNGTLRAIDTAPDGRLWLAGQFNDWDGTTVSNLVVLNGDLNEPAIISQPDEQIVDPATTVSFSVEVFSARPVTYEWRRDGTPLVNGGDISGTDTDTLQLANAELADEGDYSVVVSTAFFAVESEPAPLLVNDAPRILSEPSAGTVLAGDALTLSAEVVALAPASYSWTRDGAEVGTSPELTLDPITLADEGIYQLTVTNALGSAQTTPVFIEVVPPPAGLNDIYADLEFGQAPAAILPLPDGRTLVASQNAPTDADGSVSGSRLFVVNPDGRIDDSYDFSFILGNLNGLYRQPDGKILITGSFSQVDGLPRNDIARLNADLTHDTSFDSPGPGSETILDIGFDDSGRIYVGGSFSSWDGLSSYRTLCRLFPDGSLDTTFQPGLDSNLQDLIVLDDGRILVGGSMTFNSPIYRIGLLNPDGTADESFSPSVPGNVNALVLTPDGTGVYVSYGTGRLRRYLLADESWDQSFELGTPPNRGTINDLHVQTDGKLIATGSFYSTTQSFPSYLTRLLPDGTLDPTFDPGDGFPSSSSFGTTASAVDGLGRIWVANSSTVFDGTLVDTRLFVFNGDEVDLDILADPASLAVEPGEAASFTVFATGTSPLSYQWMKNGTPLSDNGRLSGTTAATLNFAFTDPNDGGFYSVEVSNEAGTVTSGAAELVILAEPEVLSPPKDLATEVGLEATFQVNARGVSPLSYQWFLAGTPLADGPGVSGATTAALTLSDLEIADSGEIFVRVSNPLGTIDSAPADLLVEKFPASRDPSIVLPVSVSSRLNDIVLFDDGGYLIAGFFSSVSHASGSASRRSLAKFNADGSLDPDVPEVNNSGYVEVLAHAPDGKVYLGGSFTSLDTPGGTVSRTRIARLNADLSLDTTFDAEGTGPASTVESILPLANGQVLIGGRFNSVNSLAGTAKIALLNADGSVDTSFVSQASWTVEDIASDGSGGYWLSHANYYDGQRDIVRLDATGAVATGFNYTGNMRSYRLLANPDGSVYSLSDSRSPFIQRIELDGAHNDGWPASGTSGTDDDIESGLLLPDGKIVLGGAFDRYNFITRNRIAVLNPDGSLHEPFDPLAGFNGSPSAIRTDADGRLWVVGSFTSYQGESVPRMVVLNGFDPDAVDPYETFVAALPNNQQGENDDADGDGWPNLVEFLFGTDPGNGSVHPTPIPTGTATNGASLNGTYGLSLDPAVDYQLVEVEIPKDLQGLTVHLEASRDLTFSGDATAIEAGTPTDNGTTETRRYVLTPAIEDADRLFWRLVVTR